MLQLSLHHDGRDVTAVGEAARRHVLAFIHSCAAQSSARQCSIVYFRRWRLRVLTVRLDLKVLQYLRCSRHL